ncbi:hypothetical protein Patl1_36581 [Pistacia atlantica]|nr:hypothetical protein Patl1_36581 [Pistacia atlantica]
MGTMKMGFQLTYQKVTLQFMLVKTEVDT